MASLPDECRTATGSHRSHSWMSGSHKGTAPIRWSRSQSQSAHAQSVRQLIGRPKTMNQWYRALMLISIAAGIK